MNPLRILIVEDDAIIAMFLEDILTGMGHEVCAIAATERDAVNEAARWRPDLMIVDANLYEGSGMSAVVEILRSGFVPHFFMSGDPQKVRLADPDAIIVQKPFAIPDLAPAIRSALSRRPAANHHA